MAPQLVVACRWSPPVVHGLYPCWWVHSRYGSAGRPPERNGLSNSRGFLHDVTDDFRANFRSGGTKNLAQRRSGGFPARV